MLLNSAICVGVTEYVLSASMTSMLTKSST